MRYLFKSAFGSLMMLCLGASATAMAGGDTCYDLEEVNVPDDDGGDLYTSWYGINASGEVVGNYCIDPGCAPVGDDDQIVGGAIYDPSDGSFETFTLPSPYNWVGSLKISATGVVVGQAVEASTTTGAFLTAAGFVRDTDGTLTILEQPTETTENSFAEGINPSGMIVGWFIDDTEDDRWRGWVYDDGTYTVYDGSSTGNTLIFGVNSRGDIVGQIRDEDGFHGFIDEGAVRGGGSVNPDPEQFDVPDAWRTYARGVNAKGTMVGYFAATTGSSRSGFVFDGDDFVTVEFPDAVDTRVTDISNSGVIVGTYDYASWGFIGTPTSCD